MLQAAANLLGCMQLSIAKQQQEQSAESAAVQ
jgi:hypothetical protein